MKLSSASHRGQRHQVGVRDYAWALSAALLLGLPFWAGCETDGIAQSQQPADARYPKSTAPASTQRLSPCPRIIPWTMLPTAHSRRDVEELVSNLKAWQPVASTACVSTGPGQASVFAELRRRVPEIELIPGLVSSSWIGSGPFESPASWRQLANEMAVVARTCNQKRVLLDNEGALWAFLGGKVDIDERRLRAALAHVPDDVQVIWYPAMYWVDPEQRRRSEWLCRVVAEELNCRFVDASFGDHTWAAPGPTEVRRKLDSLGRNPTLPIVWFGCWPQSKWCYWEYEQVGEVLEALAGRDEFLVYPGMKRFGEAAAHLVPLVRQKCDRR